MNFSIIFILSFSIGIFIASFVDFNIYLGFLFLILGSVFFVLRYILKSKPIFLAGLLFLALGLGLFWYGFYDDFSKRKIDLLKGSIDEQIIFSGIIIEEPDKREKYTRYIIEDQNGLNILIYAHRYPVFKYGDEIKVEGILKKPKQFSDDFDWPAYLSKDNIYFEMFYPEVEFLSSGNGFWIKRQLFLIKEKFLNTLSQLISEPHSSLLGGLTVGAKESMPKDLQEDFRETGIIHIVVLSGYNVTIVADAIMRVFSFLPHLFGISFGVLGIVFFALMTGASATIVRASLMAVLVLVARATGRIYHITTALFIAGFLMIVHNPKILVFDSSFQLSFLATLALICLVPILEPRLKFFPNKFKLREFAVATIATQIFVLPLLLYKTGLFSVVSLPVNLLILIFVPVTMFFGFVTASFGFISSFLATPFAWISFVLLEYELRVVEFFAQLPFASFKISSFPLWLVIFMYVVYAFFILRTRNIDKEKNV
jgi:competence protein ComEC